MGWPVTWVADSVNMMRWEEAAWLELLCIDAVKLDGRFFSVFSPYNHCWWKTTPIVKETTPGETPFKLGWKRDWWSALIRTWSWLTCWRSNVLCIVSFEVTHAQWCWKTLLTAIPDLCFKGKAARHSVVKHEKCVAETAENKEANDHHPTNFLNLGEPRLTCLELQNPTTQHRNFVAKHVSEVNEASWLWQFRHSDRRLLFTREFLDAPKKVICKNSNIESI